VPGGIWLYWGLSRELSLPMPSAPSRRSPGRAWRKVQGVKMAQEGAVSGVALGLGANIE